MSKTNFRSWLVGLGMSALVIAVASVRLQADVFSDCVGKPYGYPGCPTRDTSSPAPVPVTCGDGIVQTGEQCDKGRFNGQSDCSTSCTTLYCGDSITTPQIGEECEPQTEEVYTQDPYSGELVTETRFKSNGGQCGSYCAPPSCDASGRCSGGCRWAFVYVCASSSAQAQTVATPAAAPPPPEPFFFSFEEVASSSDDGTQFLMEASSSSSMPVSSSSSSSSVAPLPPPPLGPTLFTAIPVCGNGTIDIGEECDDANLVENDNCTTTCRIPRCGDGIQQAFEECDDGNRTNNDDCTNSCRLATCGDGIVQDAEECDDGNRLQGDNCSNECRFPQCGDGVTQRGEECDDGNDSDLDACSGECKKSRCGDGLSQTGEQCDDGNRVQNDSCSNDCRISMCGDGIVQPGEQCDSGADNSDTVANRCRRTCKFPVCGDNVVDQGEQCDGTRNCSQCRIVRSSASVSSSSSSLHAAATVRSSGLSQMARSVMAGAIGVLGVASIAGSLILRRKIAKALHPAPASIDDIPLDQIEMPWHKW